MGCATSKLHDDSPAVALCRHRCSFLDEALRHRFAFAQAHAAYLHSLNSVGLSLQRFFNQDLGDDVVSSLETPSSSPLLNLPAQRKGDPHPSEPPGSSPDIIQHHLHSLSDSGSHLHFHSDSEDGSGSESLHHHDATTSPVHHQPVYGRYTPEYENFNFNLPGAAGGGGGGFMNISYMKNQTTPSVVYTQRPMSPATMHIGESSSSYYPYPNYANNSNHNPPYLNHNNSIGHQNYGASTSTLPPPPPPPPKSSTWDFLNPFETFEKYYPAYNTTPSHDSREEEEIPDLEDENDEVIVKKDHGDRKPVDIERSSYAKTVASEEDSSEAKDSDLQNMMHKNAVDGEGRPKDHGFATEFKARGGFKDDLEVVKEIQVQFQRASESGNDLAKFLEVEKLPYKPKHSSYHFSSKLLHLPVVSSKPSTSKTSDNADLTFLDIDAELMSKNLSSTLHKLYLWEKKLYEEVKVEERLRVLHERKSKKMKRMDERGSEAHKVDATRTLVRSLSTKIKIAIQVVDKISVKINRLRDEELWPQLNEFIQGLTRMWKSMLECHRNQCQAIGEAKRLDAIASRKHVTDSHFEATHQLEHDLINWTQWFSLWVGAQKGYVRALNNWLTKCLLYIPEETPDGTIPFSPSRIGAPPVFVVCNQWSQSLDRLSEKEVVESMHEFASNVLQLWNRDKAEMRQRMLANKDERKIKSLEKEDQKIQKEIQALDKRMVLIDNDVPLTGRRPVYQSETTKGGSLQASLKHVLEAMGQFSAKSLKIHEELLLRIEEDHLAREHNEEVP